MGVKEFNQPIVTANRKLVASENGGLHNPSYLVFNGHWSSEPAQDMRKKFSYPSVSGVRRPESEEDIAFMSVSTLLSAGNLNLAKLWTVVAFLFVYSCKHEFWVVIRSLNWGNSLRQNKSLRRSLQGFS